MKAIDGATFVAMQPSAIGAKRNEISERSVRIVPRDEAAEKLKLSCQRCWQQAVQAVNVRGLGATELCDWPAFTRRYGVTVLTSLLLGLGVAAKAATFLRDS